MKNNLLLVMVFSIITFDILNGSSFGTGFGPGWQNNVSHSSFVNYGIPMSGSSGLRLNSTPFVAPRNTTSDNLLARVGASKATYAPSQAENMLGRLISELEFLRSGLRKLRMDDYETFRKYFEHLGKGEMKK